MSIGFVQGGAPSEKRIPTPPKWTKRGGLAKIVFHFLPISDMSITKVDEYHPEALIGNYLLKVSAEKDERMRGKLSGFRFILNHNRSEWTDTAVELAPNLLRIRIEFLGSKMENILREMNELPGVRGSFVCDGNGLVISTAMPQPYRGQVEHIGREVVQVVALLQMLGEETDILDFLFSDGRILVNGLRDFSLIVFCEPSIDISMVRLRSNVTLGEIRRDGRFKKHMQKVSKTKKGLLAGKGLAESYQQIIKKLKPLER